MGEYHISIEKRGKRGAYLSVAKDYRVPLVNSVSKREFHTEYVFAMFGDAVEKAKKKAKKVVDEEKQRVYEKNNKVEYEL